GLLDGLALPDADLYDEVYRLQLALQGHDRARAAEAHARLAEKAPGHRLTLQARRLLAQYDADPAGLLAAVEALLGLFPDDAGLAQAYFATARHLKKADEALAFLRARCGRLGALSGQPARTLFWACELCERAPEAFAALDAGLALRPGDGELLLFAADAHLR